MHCTKIPAQFECVGHSPLGAHTQKCGVGLRCWENERRLSSQCVMCVSDGQDETAGVTDEHVVTSDNQVDVLDEVLPGRGTSANPSDSVEPSDSSNMPSYAAETSRRVDDNEEDNSDEVTEVNSAAAAAESQSTQSDAAGNNTGSRSPRFVSDTQGPHQRRKLSQSGAISLNSNFCRYSAHIEENANKLHFGCTDFNSSTRVTVCA